MQWVAGATLLLSPMGTTGLRLPFLIVMAACTLYAGLVISPEARSLKSQMKEQPENKEALEPKFKSLHVWSVRLKRLGTDPGPRDCSGLTADTLSTLALMPLALPHRPFYAKPNSCFCY